MGNRGLILNAARCSVTWLLDTLKYRDQCVTCCHQDGRFSMWNSLDIR